MVLIISNTSDRSTDNVINWLKSKSNKYIRINEEDNVTLSYIFNDVKFKVNKKEFNLSEITSVWYRRGEINNNLLSIQDAKEIKDYGILEFLDLEEGILKEYLYYQLTQKKHLNDFFNRHLNKLIICEIAKKSGLKVPNSYLVDNKKSLSKIEGELITKTIYGSPIVKIKDIKKTLYTEIVTGLPNKFGTIFYAILL